MEVGKLYIVNRGNQNQSVGLIIKGGTSSVQVFGSQAKPSSLSDMVDLTDSETLGEGSHSFTMLPKFVYFTGTTDSIEPITANLVEAESKDQF